METAAGAAAAGATVLASAARSRLSSRTFEKNTGLFFHIISLAGEA